MRNTRFSQTLTPNKIVNTKHTYTSPKSARRLEENLEDERPLGRSPKKARYASYRIPSYSLKQDDGKIMF